MFTRTIAAVVAVIAISLSVSAQTPVTPFSMIGHDAMREQALSTNAQNIRIVVSMLSVLSSKSELDESVYSEYVKYFAEPTTDSYLFSSACEMLNIVHTDPAGLVDYISQKIYHNSNLGTTEIAANHVEKQLSQTEAIRHNAKVVGFNNEITSVAMAAILNTVKNAEADSLILAKKAHAITTSVVISNDND